MITVNLLDTCKKYKRIKRQIKFTVTKIAIKQSGNIK